MKQISLAIASFVFLIAGVLFSVTWINTADARYALPTIITMICAILCALCCRVLEG